MKHSEPELVVPTKSTPYEIKKLSDIDDQEGLRFHLPQIMFYENNDSMKGEDPALVVKRALGEALVYYYPLAGRLIEGPNRKLMVDCNGEGVLFVEADADITLKQLGHAIRPPCPYMKEFLSPVPGSEAIIGCPLLLFQVTRLKCRGFVLAIRMNHTMCDTIGLVQLLNMVGEIAKGATISQIPVWQRELLSARDSPTVTCLHHEYQRPTPMNHTKETTMASNDIAHESFFFEPKQILSIRSHLPHNLRKCSTFEVLTACLWKCRTIALDLDPNEIVGVSPIITAHGKQMQGLQLPEGYYGNAFAFPIALSKAGLLCKNPLSYALNLIRETKAKMNEEYIKSVADFMVLKGRPMYRTIGNYLVADTTKIRYYNVDFGWGKPIYGGPTGAIPYYSFYSRFRNGEGEEGIVVPILLPRNVMKRFFSELVKITTEKVIDHHDDDSYGIMDMGITSKL